MKFAKIFFGFTVLVSVFSFVSLASAQVSSCTHSGQDGTCVLGSSDCASGSVYGGTECTGNNERTLCCVLGGGGGGEQEGKACTSPGEQNGKCYNTCPSNLSFITRSSTCSSRSVGINCCVANSDSGGGGGSCPDTSSHCKANCTDYGGIKGGCDSACLAGTGNYYYCVSTTQGGSGSGSPGGGGKGSVDTSTGWTGGLAAVTGGSGLPSSSVDSIMSGLLTWILTIFGFIAIIGFVISGILYLTAAGNDSQIKLAKTAMTWSIVGVIVALVGYVVVQAVNIWLGGGSAF